LKANGRDKEKYQQERKRGTAGVSPLLYIDGLQESQQQKVIIIIIKQGNKE
jgi:hypothetical protein